MELDELKKSWNALNGMHFFLHSFHILFMKPVK